MARRAAVLVLLAGCEAVPPANPAACPGAETTRFALSRLAPEITHTLDRSDPARVMLDASRPGAPRVVQVLAQGLVAIDRQTATDRVQMQIAGDLAGLFPLRSGAGFESALTVITPRGEPLPGGITVQVGAPGRVVIGDCAYDTLSVESVTTVGPYATRLVQDYAPALGTVVASENPASATQAPERLVFERIEIAPTPQGSGLIKP